MDGAQSKQVGRWSWIAVAAAYAACYELTRYFSFSHWILPAGLRLASLLLVPRRYWPALALGEALPVMENAALCAPQFGLGWALLAGTPLIVLCMPVVALAQRKGALYRANGEINIGMIVAMTLVCAIINAVVTDLALFSALLASPGAWPDLDTRAYFFAYLLGAYLGALTLTPSILALRDIARTNGRAAWRLAWHSPVALGAGAAMLVTMSLTHFVDGWALQACRLGTLVPVLAMTLRYGWRGGALAGLAASIAVASTSTVLLDPPIVHVQVILALLLTGALLIGVPITRRLAARRLIGRTALH